MTHFLSGCCQVTTTIWCILSHFSWIWCHFYVFSVHFLRIFRCFSRKTTENGCKIVKETPRPVCPITPPLSPGTGPHHQLFHLVGPWCLFHLFPFVSICFHLFPFVSIFVTLLEIWVFRLWTKSYKRNHANVSTLYVSRPHIVRKQTPHSKITQKLKLHHRNWDGCKRAYKQAPFSIIQLKIPNLGLSCHYVHVIIFFLLLFLLLCLKSENKPNDTT